MEKPAHNVKAKKIAQNSAYSFIILIGIVSLFSDLTHEGARSIIGPYLGLLGASAVTIGFVTGLGEFIGYALRLVTGVISDRTRQYWAMTIVGYGINLIAIPMLAFAPANGWIYASGLIILERIGKAIRNPSKNTLVSFAASEVGAGKGFAILEALDQIGAFLGPVMLFIILTLKGSTDLRAGYTISFLSLGVTAIIALAFLFLAKKRYPEPHQFDKGLEDTSDKIKFARPFWLYMLAISLFAFGYADFPLVSYHFVRQGLFDATYVPLLYALAMGVDAIAALIFGWAYDRKGMKSLVAAISLSAFFAPLVFLTNNLLLILAGVVLWGIGMGAQESILKSVVTTLVAKNRRATAFGIFNTGFGLFWFIGSTAMGYFYDRSLLTLVGISIAAQLLAIPILLRISKSQTL